MENKISSINFKQLNLGMGLILCWFVAVPVQTACFQCSNVIFILYNLSLLCQILPLLCQRLHLFCQLLSLLWQTTLARYNLICSWFKSVTHQLPILPLRCFVFCFIFIFHWEFADNEVDAPEEAFQPRRKAGLPRREGVHGAVQWFAHSSCHGSTFFNADTFF